MEISKGRQEELAERVQEVMDRYPKTFKENLTEEDLLKILEEIELDGRKAWVRKFMGSVTFADRHHLVKLFKTRKVLREMEDGKTEEEQEAEGEGAGEGAATGAGKTGADSGGSKKKKGSK